MQTFLSSQVALTRPMNAKHRLWSKLLTGSYGSPIQLFLDRLIRTSKVTDVTHFPLSEILS